MGFQEDTETDYWGTESLLEEFYYWLDRLTERHGGAMRGAQAPVPATDGGTEGVSKERNQGMAEVKIPF